MTAGSCLREAVNPAASPARRSCGGNGHSAHGGRRPGGSPPGYRFALRIARLVALGGLFAVPQGLEIARGQELDIEKARYALAVEYCRGDMARPLSLSADRQTLCLDGEIPDRDHSQVHDLLEHGLFVVRSVGGSMYPAIEIANLLDAKNATVVIYDYCLSACASYFFTASKRTHVLGTALVAFHYPISGEPDCPYIGQTPDNEDKRLIVEPCSDLRPVENFALEISGGHGWKRDRDFYDKRVIDRQYGSPPQSSYMRKYLRGLFERRGQLPNVLWMWNPRFYRSAVKTDISYDEYPETQSEVDQVAAGFFLSRFRIVLDP